MSKDSSTTVKRDTVVKQQSDAIMQVIAEHDHSSGDAISLQNKILGLKFADGKSLKPDAIKLAMSSPNMASQGEHIRKALIGALDSRNVGENKQSSSFKEVGTKTTGLTDGSIVEKIKNNKKIMAKNANDIEGYKGGEVCEYISTNLANIFMPEDTPKFRLHVDEGTKQVKVASTFIPNFMGFSDYTTKNKFRSWPSMRAKVTEASDGPKVQGFATCFATAFLTGHYDIHGNNVGIRLDQDKKQHFALIDFGRGLSYNIDCNWKGGLTPLGKNTQSVEMFKNRMIELNNYASGRSFRGEKFASELKEFVQSIDVDRVKHVVELSIKNLKLAYGENFLENEQISKELKLRMGIDKGAKITEELLTNKITENIKRCKNELEQMANKELVQVKLQALKTNDTKLVERIDKLTQQSASLGQRTQFNQNCAAVEQDILKQRSIISTIQVKLGMKTLTAAGLTQNEQTTADRIKSALQHASVDNIKFIDTKHELSVTRNAKTNQHSGSMSI